MSLNSPPPSASVSSDSFNKCVNNKVNLNANGALNFLPANPDIESSIYKSIDSLAKAVHDRVNILDRDFALHVAIYLERKEQVNLHLRGLEEKIDHAKERLLTEIKELKAEVNDMRDRK